MAGRWQSWRGPVKADGVRHWSTVLGQVSWRRPLQHMIRFAGSALWTGLISQRGIANIKELTQLKQSGSLLRSWNINAAAYA